VRRRVIRWFRPARLLDAAAAADMLARENSRFSVDARCPDHAPRPRRAGPFYSVARAVISWSSSLTLQESSNFNRAMLPGSFASDGTLVFAENVGGSAQTFDGIDWGSGESSNPDRINFGSFASSYTSSGSGQIQRWATWSASAETVTLENLTVGQEYRIQALIYDGRGGDTFGRTARLDSTDLGQFAWGVGGVSWGEGMVATGIFTADATNQGGPRHLGDGAGEIGPVRIPFERVSDNRGRNETTHLVHERCAYFGPRVEWCEPLFERGDEIGRLTLVVADFQRNAVGREFHALLSEPCDVPEVTVLEAILPEGDRDDLVGEDFLPALRLKDQARSAKVDAIQHAEHHGMGIMAGDGSPAGRFRR